MFAGWAGRKPFSSMGWLRLPDYFTRWQTTATNPWGAEMEQGTAGGLFRHRSFDDDLKPTAWILGPHPIAQRLRDDGKEETDCFDRVTRL